MRELRISTILFIVSILFVFVLAGVYAFLFLDLKKRNEAIVLMNHDVVRKEQQQRERLELERTIVTTDADRQTLESYFVTGDKAVAFLETLESYGKLAGTAFEIRTVDITNTGDTAKATAQSDEETDNKGATAAAEVKKEKSALVFTAHALGRFQDVYHLLLLLENAPYEFDFKNVRMRRLPDTTTTDSLPKVPGIERIAPVSVPFLWDIEFTVALVTFTPSAAK